MKQSTPAAAGGVPPRSTKPEGSSGGWALPWEEFRVAAILLGLVTLGALLIEPFVGHLAIAPLYLLLVVALGLKLSRAPVLLVATASALLWNFLFTEPHFTVFIENVHETMLFAMFFVVALAMGHLTSRLRSSELLERSRERHTAALYNLAHQAALAPDLDSGLRAAVTLIQSLFGADAALLLRSPDHTLATTPHPSSSLRLPEKDISAARWAFSQRTPAGKFTDTFPESDALHLPLQARTAVMGVLSVRPQGHSFDSAERELLEAFSALMGTILEKDHFIEAFKRAEMMEASERLYRTLFDSVSHELKTPLSAVQAGVDAIATELGSLERGHIALQEIQSAVRRLRRVIDNLLDMSRIEAGVIELKVDWSDVGELVRSAVELAREALHQHRVLVEVSEEFPMVKLDQPMLEQCLRNLLINAAAWSRGGTDIVVRAALESSVLLISVLDQGKGISDSDLPHVFDKFYRACDAAPGGTGLGLSIVQGLVRAHGGTATVANRETGGAEFSIRIPVEVMPPELMKGLH